jgi:hypothetical protein
MTLGFMQIAGTSRPLEALRRDHPAMGFGHFYLQYLNDSLSQNMSAKLR